MKAIACVLLISVLAACTDLGQRGPGRSASANPTASPAAGTRPSASTAPGGRGRGGAPAIRSPEVHADRTVTFRLQAPKASEVTLTGDWLPAAQKLTKDDKGLWSVTVGPMEPGLAIYSFTMDGVAIADPANPRMKLRAQGSGSLVDVPGTGTEPWVMRDVPHGTVDITYHRSTVLNGDREFRVYTPPGYDQNPNVKYPVLYLLHGNNDTQAGWVDAGRANVILDNLIADKKAVPMIIVMPFGHATTGATGPFDFTRYFLEDVMPTAEKSYRIIADRDHRAIAGYSMGGGQSLSIGLDHLDLFSAVGGFSAAVGGDAATRYKALMDDPAGTNAKLKLLWVGCGRQDSLFNAVQSFAQTMNSHNIHTVWYPTEGRHTFTVWRKYLIEVAPLLFQTK